MKSSSSKMRVLIVIVVILIIRGGYLLLKETNKDLGEAYYAYVANTGEVTCGEAVTEDNQYLWTANRFSNDVTVIDIAAN